jgi:endothelin-converting enzyme/putative endopeptidase
MEETRGTVSKERFSILLVCLQGSRQTVPRIYQRDQQKEGRKDSDLCLNGKQILTDNIADLAGLLTAHDAYVLSLKGKTDVVIGGLTGEQRFFLAFAQRWRKAQSEEALRRQIKTDTHSPGEYRSDTVRNVEAWYKAYDVLPGDRLYLKREDRVGIW